jgi:hypothetical protein
MKCKCIILIIATLCILSQTSATAEDQDRKSIYESVDSKDATIWLGALKIRQMFAPNDKYWDMIFPRLKDACFIKYPWLLDDERLSICAVKYVCSLELDSSKLFCEIIWLGEDGILNNRQDAKLETITNEDVMNEMLHRT